MQSQDYEESLNGLRQAIASTFQAIVDAYPNRDEVEALINARARFTIPPTGTALTKGIRLIPDNASGDATYTLPTTPTNGMVVEWRPSATPFTTNALVFLRGGNNIQGQAQDLTVDVNGQGGRLVWVASANSWIVDVLSTEAT